MIFNESDVDVFRKRTETDNLKRSNTVVLKNTQESFDSKLIL